VTVELKTPRLVLRPWRRGDERALMEHGNHREVWKTLADLFPHPYTRADADAWIAHVAADDSGSLHLAITVDGEPVGGVGLIRQGDTERLTGIVGYWLGPSVWKRGYATEALGALVAHAFAHSDLVRLQAKVFENNPASCRVIEKAGFVREARLRRAVIKDGELLDAFLYARLRE
jgi:[ribosomal protein S5]-alanine N-acetyltransferase